MPSSPLCIRVSKETRNKGAYFRLLTATMTIGSSTRVKNQVRDGIEDGFDHMHRVVDTVTFPLAAVDGAIHGVARGVLNWLTDTHPDHQDRKKKCKPAGHGSTPPPPNPYYCAPAPAPAYAQPYPYAYSYGCPPPPPPPPGLAAPLPPPNCQDNGYVYYGKQQSRISTWTSSGSNGHHPGQSW